MRILLTGAAGQLGRHLAPRLGELGEVVTTDLHSGDFRCDLSDRRLLDKALGRVRPDLIVNPAAWTAVDRAEEEPGMAQKLNRDLPGWLGTWAAEHDVPLVHFSTDYVFSGTREGGWSEDDEPDPQSVYGRSKLEGELAIEASGANALIVRTAWLYSHFPGNFLSAILTRAERGEKLTVVSDQIGSPTWAGHLADAVVELLRRRSEFDTGVTRMHFAGNGRMSWHAFAELAVARAAEHGVIPAPVAVEPIASARWPQKARRPAWSVLDCSRFEALVGRPVPSVEDGLTGCLNRWTEDRS